jgi:hypothetical protein
VAETIYGKYSKYEIVGDLGDLLTSTSFYIHKDGTYRRGFFASLRGRRTG